MYLESNLYPIFMFTLNFHLKCSNRIMNLPENRSGHILIDKIQINNSFWVKGWENLENKFKQLQTGH